MSAPHPPTHPPRPQSLHKLSEPKALVRCREVDVPLVRDVLAKAQDQFKATFETAAPQVRFQA